MSQIFSVINELVLFLYIKKCRLFFVKTLSVKNLIVEKANCPLSILEHCSYTTVCCLVLTVSVIYHFFFSENFHFVTALKISIYCMTLFHNVT